MAIIMETNGIKNRLILLGLLPFFLCSCDLSDKKIIKDKNAHEDMLNQILILRNATDYSFENDFRREFPKIVNTCEYLVFCTYNLRIWYQKEYYYSSSYNLERTFGAFYTILFKEKGYSCWTAFTSNINEIRLNEDLAIEQQPLTSFNEYEVDENGFNNNIHFNLDSKTTTDYKMTYGYSNKTKKDILKMYNKSNNTNKYFEMGNYNVQFGEETRSDITLTDDNIEEYYFLAGLSMSYVKLWG